jgi:UDP-2,4-diacetamido-2,4,6-trideoxy-beta-L-altropyranose hydrolase
MSSASTIVLRADAFSEIGFGHLSRCLTLEGAFRARGVRSVLALCRESHAAAAALDNAVEHRLLDVARLGEADAEQTIRLARETGASAVVVDGYGFRDGWIDAVRASQLRCAYIDDFATGRYDCDAVLNHNVFAEGLLLDAPPSCVQLLGPSFALLRPSFRAARQQRSLDRTTDVPERIVVTLGGSDPTGTTLRIIEWIGAAGCGGLPPMHARVVLGSAFRDIGEARSRAATSSVHRIEIVTDVSDLAELFEWADLVVTAAGVTCLEVACVGVPALIVCLADNQRRPACGVSGRGMALNLGEHDSLTSEILLDGLSRLRIDRAERRVMVSAQRAVVDGAGAGRAAEALVSALTDA